jgi:hypothetical protein
MNRDGRSSQVRNQHPLCHLTSPQEQNPHTSLLCFEPQKRDSNFALRHGKAHEHLLLEFGVLKKLSQSLLIEYKGAFGFVA